MVLFKKINAWLHLWLGLASGIVVFILGVTGCILVFEQEIKSLTRSWFHAEQPAGKEYLPPSVLQRAAAKAFPAFEIHGVWYHGEGRTAHLSTNTDSMVYINPYTAEIVAVAHDEDFFHFIDEGHRHLWLPQKVGQPIVSWGTFIFFLLLISGIILWWPKKWTKHTRKQAFTIKWKASFKRVNYDLHNVLGFYSLIVAAVLAFTGLSMSFAWFSNGVYWLAGGKENKERIKPVSDSTLAGKTVMFDQVDKAWKMGLTEIGERNRDQIIVHFPDEGTEAIYLCVDMYKGSWRDVYLDQYTLQQLPASGQRIREASAANWLRRMNYGLHVGEIGGLTTKIFYFLASLICASLPVTGFYVWWGKKRKRPLKGGRRLPVATAAT